MSDVKSASRTAGLPVYVSLSIVLTTVLVLPLAAESQIGYNGMQVQAALGDDGDIHIVFTEDFFGAVFYMRYNGSTWSSPQQLPGSGDTWIPFSYPNIDVGPDGLAQIVYGNVTGDWPHDFDYFYYAKALDENGTGWDVQVKGNDGDRRAYYDIAVDDNNLPHIVYEKTGTNSAPPFWSAIGYYDPWGGESTLVFYPDGSFECKNPCVAYGNNLVHVAWFAGGFSVSRNEIYYSSGTSGNFSPPTQATFHDANWFDYPPEIAINPANGDVIITYLTSQWYGEEGGLRGNYWVNPITFDSGTIDGTWVNVVPGLEFEDQSPHIAFSNDGTRYVSWSYIYNNRAYYKIDNGPTIELNPYGWIDVAAGNGAYYVRAATEYMYLNPPEPPEPGPLYFEQLAGGGPTYYPPTAIIDNITPDPVRRGVHFAVSFFGTGFDNDEGGSSIDAWYWTSNLSGDLGFTEDIAVLPIDLEPGRHTISFQVMDDESVWSNIDVTNLDVLPDTIPPPAVADMSVALGVFDVLNVEWDGVVDNLAMDHYELYRDSTAWFMPTTPLVEIPEGEPLQYTDVGVLSGGQDAAFYLVIPVDVDGNSEPGGARAGGYRFDLEIGSPR